MSFSLSPFGVQPNKSAANINLQLYYCSANKSMKSSEPTFITNGTLDTLSSSWSGAGAVVSPADPQKGLNLEPNTTTCFMQLGESGIDTNTLNVYLAPLSATPATTAVTLQLKDSKNKVISLNPPQQFTNQPYTINVTAGEVSVTCPSTQLFFITFTTTTTVNVKYITMSYPQASNGRLLFQAFSIPRQANASLTYFTLRPRGELNRDRHSATDDGSFLLLPGVSSAPNAYKVTIFNTAPPQKQLEARDQLYYASGDLTISSELLSNAIAPNEGTLYNVTSTDLGWASAGGIARTVFQVTKPSFGIRAAVLTVFFNAAIMSKNGGVAGKNTIFSMFTSTPTGEYAQLAISPSTVRLPDGWSMSVSNNSIVITAPTSTSSPALTAMPFLQLQYVPSAKDGSDVPLITKIQSTYFPMQFITASPTPIASITDVSSPCYDFDAVKRSKQVLFYDQDLNARGFDDGLYFSLQNVSLNNTIASNRTILYNSSQTTERGPYFTEQRENGTGTWYTVPATSSNNAAPSRYFFEKYVPTGSQYRSNHPSGVPASVILLKCEQRTFDASGNLVVGQTGYVACKTDGSASFSPTSFSGLISKDEAIAREVQWGVVFAEGEFSQLGVGSAYTNSRPMAIAYAEASLRKGLPCIIGVGTTPASLAPPTDPLTGLTGAVLGHGIVKTGSVYDALQYNPETLLVQTTDRDNLIPYTGFTANNTFIQWLMFPAAITAAQVSDEDAALTATIQAARGTAQQLDLATLRAYDALAVNSVTLNDAAKFERRKLLLQLVADTVQADQAAVLAGSTNDVAPAQTYANQVQQLSANAGVLLKSLFPGGSALSEIVVGREICSVAVVGKNARYLSMAIVILWFIMICTALVLIALRVRKE